MNFTFIYNKNDGWLLKITTLEQLLEYWKYFDEIMEQAIVSMKETKEFGNKYRHANDIEALIGSFSSLRFSTYEDTKNSILLDLRKAQYNSFVEDKVIYINKNHGWNSIEKDVEQFVHKNIIEFPKSLKNGKINIKKFPLGNHYYLYIDDIQIRDGNKLKWNTYEEAENFAKKYTNL